MEEILSYLNEIAKSQKGPLSTECLNYLGNTIKYGHVKKGHYILKPGEVCVNLYFIKKGLLKCFYYHKEKQIFDWFFTEGEVVVSIQSFYEQQLSTDYIEAGEDCELYYITFDELNYLYWNFPEFNAVGRVLTAKYLIIWHGQTRNLRMLTGKERYAQLVKNQPDLVKRVSKKDLASFLDMSRMSITRHSSSE